MPKPTLKNCPEEYYLNCKNAIIRCNRCPAGHCSNPKAKLQYQPIDPNLLPHPHSTKTKDTLKSHSCKQGLKAEHKLISRLNAIAKPTKASGRVNHDGDILLLDSIRVEHKLRPASTKSYGITSKEYSKGKLQGIDVWAITIQDGETLYLLSESLFTSLLPQSLD